MSKRYYVGAKYVADYANARKWVSGTSYQALDVVWTVADYAAIPVAKYDEKAVKFIYENKAVNQDANLYYIAKNNVNNDTVNPKNDTDNWLLIGSVYQLADIVENLPTGVVDADEVNKYISHVAQELETANQAITNNTNNITTNAAGISALDKDNATNKNDIATLKTNVQKNTDDIASLTVSGGGVTQSYNATGKTLVLNGITGGSGLSTEIQTLNVTSGNNTNSFAFNDITARTYLNALSQWTDLKTAFVAEDGVTITRAVGNSIVVMVEGYVSLDSLVSNNNPATLNEGDVTVNTIATLSGSANETFFPVGGYPAGSCYVEINAAYLNASNDEYSAVKNYRPLYFGMEDNSDSTGTAYALVLTMEKLYGATLTDNVSIDHCTGNVFFSIAYAVKGANIDE